VILLPVQQNLGVRGDLDAEIRFTFTDQGREVDWIFEEAVQRMLDRTPTMDTRTRGLPVSLFSAAEVERVGDPLYGQLRRMAALVEADAILIPIEASFEPNEAVVDSEPRVRFTAAIIEPRTGRVVWFGVEEGGDFGGGCRAHVGVHRPRRPDAPDQGASALLLPIRSRPGGGDHRQRGRPEGRSVA
jgi:hypothetical protein